MASLSVRGESSRIAVAGSCVFLLGLVALLLIVPGARAAETILWNNYSGDPDTIGFANIDGSGGGTLNLGGQAMEGPEGMAYDTVTNKLFVAAYSTNKIIAINLDGSGATSFTAPGAPVAVPEGLTLDPVTRMIYWINTATDTISWARLDGSAGGVLSTTGADVNGGYRLALDPVGGRVYWTISGPGPGSSIVVNYANVNNTGGGTLNIAGAALAEGSNGLAVDPAGNRLYWLNNTTEGVSYASLAGGGGGNLNISGANFKGAYGLAIDPALSRAYWANYGQGELKTGAIGFASLSGGGGGINIAAGPVDGPQDPIVLKSPSGSAAPAITRAKNSRSSLTCSTGTWGADFPGSFVYQAPRSFAYQWGRNGTAIAGATSSTLAAKSAGKYSCVVTAANQIGSAAQISAVANVKAAKAKLTTKKKVVVKAGGVATFKVKAINQGDLKSKNAKVCVKLPKAAKAALKAPKCKKLGRLKGHGKKGATLKIGVLPSASGIYSVSFVVKGSAGKAAKAKIVVVG